MTLRPSPSLAKDLEATGFIHRPLPLRREDSLESLGRDKKVLKSRLLASPEDTALWETAGPGTLSPGGIPTPQGRLSLCLELPSRMDQWPADNPQGDYTPFCRGPALFRVKGENWEAYNRLSFSVYPDCPGGEIANLALVFRNEGEFPVPDPYGREGHHELNLLNRQWNECSLEIPDLPRDRITAVGFECAAYGNAFGDSRALPLRFYIGEIFLEEVEDPEASRGWVPSKGRIAYSMAGYAAEGSKTAILAANAGTKAGVRFELRDAAGEAVYSGQARPSYPAAVSMDLVVLDFSGFKESGTYTLHCGGVSTRPFAIGDGIWADSVWKTLNFIFCERCGYPVPGKHGYCHGDVLAEHEGLRLVYAGGWHDAGDLSQQTLQTADVMYSLFEMAGKARHEEPALYHRLMEEARWGLDFIMRCRFGDGWRASSAGIVHWPDNLIGNMDDRPARAHNNAFDNFLYAAYEAHAAQALKEEDTLPAERLLAAAEEDFGFAMAVYEERGFEERPEFWEHSYNGSPSLYMAAMSWAASTLYSITGKPDYAEWAVLAGRYVLDCQHQGPGPGGISGFFYRDKDQKVIQHFNHQSREQLYVQALAALMLTQKDHGECGRWRDAVKNYSLYLRYLCLYTAPYGMLASGVYRLDEPEYADSFDRLHRFPSPSYKEEYEAQLLSGKKLDDQHYLRIFPAWFSFRGNAAIHLALGKAAAVCGNLLDEEYLRDIAREQLYWLLGKNPFCQSLMYGEGHRYGEQAVFLPGPMVGSLPVGVQTRYNEDLPYWPQTNNATYKEAWVSTAGKWLSLAAEIL